MKGAKSLFLTVSLVAVALAGCAGEEVFVEAPDWKSGYSWSFAWEAEGEWVEEFDGERENDTWDRAGTSRAEVLNTTMVVSGTPVYVVGVAEGGDDGDDWTGLQVIRQRDLANLPYDIDIDFSCFNDACTTSYDDFEVYRTDVPTFLDFPLTAGKTWSNVTEEDDFSVLHRASVAGMTAVETPLGTVAAVRIDFVQMPADPDGFRQAILEEAKDEGYDVDDLRFEVHSGSSAYYSPEYQTIVQYTGRESYVLAASGTDPDGERFDVREEGRSSYRSVLEGARLVAGPERSLDEALGVFTGDLPVRDPTGELVEEVPFSVGIDAVRDAVNVADGEAFAFEADIGGNGTLPEGFSLHWTMRDWTGAEVASGAGDAFSPEAKKPGRYAVALDVLNATGAVVAGDGANAYGDLVTQTRLDCGPVATFSSDCSMSLPVHPGVKFLGVEARSTLAGLPVDQRSVLDVRDVMGTTVPAEKEGGEWILEVDSFFGYGVGDTPWTLRWQTFASVMEEVEIGLVILYSQGRSVEDMTMGTGLENGAGLGAGTLPPAGHGSGAAHASPAPPFDALPWRR